MIPSDDVLAHLVKRIYAHDDLESLAADLETGFIDEVDDVNRSTLLYALRNAASGEMERAWATTLIAAWYQPEPFAISMHMQGRGLLVQGSYEASVEPLTVACAAYQRAKDHDGFARAAATLADSFYMLGQYDDALKKAMTAAAIFDTSHQVPALVATLSVITGVYEDQQLADQALATVEQAHTALENALLSSASTEYQQLRHKQILTHINRGRILENLYNQFDAALNAYTCAETIITAHADIFSPIEIRRLRSAIWRGRAKVQLRIGHYTDATHALHQAESCLGSDSTDREDLIELWTYRLYEAVLIGAGDKGQQLLSSVWNYMRERPSSSPRMKRQADELIMFAATKPNITVGSIFDTLVDLENQLDAIAHRFAEAQLDLNVATICIIQASLRYQHGPVARARAAINRARDLLTYHQASRLFLDTDVIYALHDPDATPEFQREVAQQLGEFGDYPVQAQVLTTLGKRYESDNQTEHAYTAYCDAINALNHVRTGLRLSSQSVQFLGQHRTPYERAFWLKRKTDPVLAWRWAEGVHAQTINDELLNHDLQALIGDDTSTQTDLQAKRQRVERLQASQSTLSFSSLRKLDDRHHQTSHERRIAEQDYTDLLERLAAEGVDAARWMRGEIAAYDDVQQILDSYTALVTFLRVEQDSERSELWATILTISNEPICVRILKSRQLANIVSEWKDKGQSALVPVQRGTEVIVPATATAQSELKNAYDVIAPVLGQLPSAITRLIIVPDERPPFIPFHALRDEQERYLIERYAISYAPSATVLLNCARRAQKRTRLHQRFLAGWNQIAPLEQLPTELAGVGSLLETMPMLDALERDATLRHMAQAGVLHLSCHGEFPTDSDSHPRFARLLLNDESLYAHDIYTTRLQADLVTLSACDAGQHGAGLQGLVSALLVAGASSVVAALWPVIDDSTPLFMKRFYTALKEGQDVAAALQTAQCALIHHDDYCHPSYWAPFFVTGVPDTRINQP